MSGDWRRLVRAIIPPLFFVSLIHSLVARAVIQRMLNSRLASDGIHPVGTSSRSGGNVFVASMPTLVTDSAVESGKRDMEASTENIIPLEKLSVSSSCPPLRRADLDLVPSTLSVSGI